MFVEYYFDHYVQFSRYVYILSPSLKLGRFLIFASIQKMFKVFGFWRHLSRYSAGLLWSNTCSVLVNTSRNIFGMFSLNLTSYLQETSPLKILNQVDKTLDTNPKNNFIVIIRVRTTYLSVCSNVGASKILNTLLLLVPNPLYVPLNQLETWKASLKFVFGC